MEYQKYKNLPNRLLEARKALNLTQEQVAVALRLKNKTLISRWERGRSVPNLITAAKLSRLYRKPMDSLFTELLDLASRDFTEPVNG